MSQIIHVRFYEELLKWNEKIYDLVEVYILSFMPNSYLNN